ncbi:hypothetical protein HRbin01_01520 [archaeon HR01]|nr:hypothetical protein HRbin01_01520 [archaeon HR01]
MVKSGAKKEKIDEKVLRDAVKRALEQPRLAFYSPLAASVLNYRKNVIPRYSISDELANIVEAAIREKWPGLATRAGKMLGRGGGMRRASRER